MELRFAPLTRSRRLRPLASVASPTVDQGQSSLKPAQVN
jgi:hypothetical protein